MKIKETMRLLPSKYFEDLIKALDLCAIINGCMDEEGDEIIDRRGQSKCNLKKCTERYDWMCGLFFPNRFRVKDTVGRGADLSYDTNLMGISLRDL
jgi:hypothetical protein